MCTITVPFGNESPGWRVVVTPKTRIGSPVECSSRHVKESTPALRPWWFTIWDRLVRTRTPTLAQFGLWRAPAMFERGADHPLWARTGGAREMSWTASSCRPCS